MKFANGDDISKNLLQVEETPQEWQTMLNQDDMVILEQRIMDAVFSEQERVGRSDRNLAAQAFGFLKTPHMKIQAIKGGPNRKPQQIRIGDLLNLCEALGLNWRDVIGDAVKAVKAK